VLDYALDCLTAEQEAETVPDEGAPQVEPPEDAQPAEPAPECDARLVAHLRAEGRT